MSIGSAGKNQMMQAKVLIVDDEVVVAEDIRRQLRSLGYTVVGVASSGADAIRLAGEHRPELISWTSS